MLYARRGFIFTPKQLCVLAYEMAVREERTGFSPIKKHGGRTWLKYFFHQNPQVKTKMSQNQSICHAMGANKVQINKFFNQLKDWLTKWKLEYSPNSIWNVDECGLGDAEIPEGSGCNWRMMIPDSCGLEGAKYNTPQLH